MEDDETSFSHKGKCCVMQKRHKSKQDCSPQWREWMGLTCISSPLALLALTLENVYITSSTATCGQAGPYLQTQYRELLWAQRMCNTIRQKHSIIGYLWGLATVGKALLKIVSKGSENGRTIVEVTGNASTILRLDFAICCLFGTLRYIEQSLSGRCCGAKTQAIIRYEVRLAHTSPVVWQFLDTRSRCEKCP